MRGEAYHLPAERRTVRHRKPRTSANTPHRLAGSFQLRPPTEDAERPDTPRIDLQDLNIKAGSTQLRPNPPDTGTEHSGDSTSQIHCENGP